MSLTASDYAKARAEVLTAGAQPRDLLEALCVIERQRQLLLAQERNAAWACGRRGDAIPKIPGLTDTLTGLLRRFAALGVVRYGEVSDLHRHVSALRKKLKAMAPSVRIATLIGEGYEITAGFDEIYRILHSGREPSLAAPGFTVKQTAILKLICLRGSVHVEQVKCLQRHMSNIRAKLPKAISIETHAGEGLYTLAKGKEALTALLDGESPAPIKRARKPRSEPEQRLAA